MYTIVRRGEIERLPYGLSFRDADGTLHPWAVISAWSDAELAAIGVSREIATEIEPVPVDLVGLKVALKSDIDAAAEAERSRYITPGSGQALTYQAKAAEAARFIEHAGIGDYPLLSAEVGVTGETLQQVAQIVINLHAQWQIVGGLIERARLAAKAAVDAAPDEAAARAVVPAWPTP